MKKFIFLFGVLLALASCESKDSKEVTTSKEAPAVEVANSKIEFSDPARIGGSSFGDFFISMLRTQNYDMALKFTSQGSIEQFGTDKVLEKYKNFKFNYNLIQKSMSKSGDTITIMYATEEYATGKLKTMKVVVENDSCKLILPDNLDDWLR